MNDLDQMTELSKQIGMTNAQRLAEANNVRARVAAGKASKSDINIKNEFVVPDKGLPIQDFKTLIGLVGILIKEIKAINIPETTFPEVQKITGTVLTDITIPEVITVSNLSSLENGLALLLKEIRGININPQVKVEVPKSSVKVESPVVNIDTKSLTKKMDDVLKAIKGMKMPEMPNMPDFPVFPVDKEGFPVVTVANMAVANNSSQNATPLDKYQPADQDETGATKYYGFLAPDRSWYIMSDTGTAQRYVAGASGYSDAWTARATQTYLLLSEAF